MEYIGFILSPDGLTMDSAKIQVIQDWLEPCKVQDIQSFLGFTNFYQWFIYNYSDIVIPLIHLTQKGTNSVAFLWWLPECFHCYQKGIHLCSSNHSLGSGCTDYSWNGHPRLHCCSHPFHYPLQWRYPPSSILLLNLDHLQVKLRHPW